MSGITDKIDANEGKGKVIYIFFFSCMKLNVFNFAIADTLIIYRIEQTNELKEVKATPNNAIHCWSAKATSKNLAHCVKHAKISEC